MSRLSPRRALGTPTKGAIIQRDASASSMERALRTLTRTNSPPRLKSGGTRHGKIARKLTFESTRSSSKISDITAPTTTSSSSEEAVKVAVRVRPLVPEGDQCADRAWCASTERNAIVETSGGRRESNYFASNNSRRGTLGGDSEFVYDRVFGEDANTCEIYNALVSDVVESVTEHGINGTVFTYGQTCSGKTFTMQGCSDPDSSIGIIQLAARDVFQSIKERQSDGIESECSVRVSYVEIYNEELRDLLNDNSRKSSSSLIIREDKQGSISVDGLKEVAVESFEQLMEVFKAGEKNKSVGSTKMNDRSSRSHAILSISLERKTTTDYRGDADDKENHEECSSSSSNLVMKTKSTLNLVDLAGSESVRHTHASGMQKKEGGMINQSLLTLSKVLMSLGQKYPGHINYRDSKLTRILKPSLSGNARMVVVCCISPSSKYVEETKSTLQFAARAKLVKTNAVANEEVEGSGVIAKLKMENAKCKMENKQLEEQLREIQKTNDCVSETERKLANLTKFVFSMTASESQDDRRAVDDLVASIRKAASRPTTPSIPDYPTSKDDRFIHQSSCGSGGVFLHALKIKAQQVKSLQAKLRNSKPMKKRKADKQKRYSLVKLAQSCDGDRRHSLIAEARCLHKEHINTEVVLVEDDSALTELDQLESKLAHAKSLIEGLERQIDDLSLQKNDALDWIEELLAKSDLKDEKIRRALEDKDVASDRCEELEDELLNTRELMRVSEAKFLVDAEDATTKISSLQAKIDSFEHENADLKSHLAEQQNLTGEYDEEKRALIEQIEMYEVELSKANASLKSKSNELDDALFSLDSERKTWLSEKNDLIGKRSSRSHDDINALIRKNDELLAELDEQDLSTDTASNDHSAEREQLQYQICGSARIDELMEENNVLSIEQSRMRDENDGLMKRVRDLTDELADQRRQLIRQESGMKAENDRLCQKNNDLANEMSSLQQQLQDANKREEKSVVAFFKSESEKSKLKSELNAATGKVNELTGKIQAMKKELISHENARTQHNQSMARVQGQVDELSLVNADLKQKNESLHMTQECIETKARELQCLYSRAIAERDEAYSTRDDLIQSNANLLANSNKISVERDRLLEEKDRIQMKLDKATEEYEADYESLRSTVDNLSQERNCLEDKVVFMEASKASIEKNADRILERNHTLERQFEQLAVEYKKQERLNAELQHKIDKVGKRMDCIRLENEQLTRDNRTLRELYHRSARS